ncbi:hypothetical protein U9M48_011233 [Paspalum notatum var. saurae]|uniref:Uncharacterized protein n=1 Tax=Paspalum notatum var. saurae TaxID=547442 RepID=A0AAQ3SUZ9_PASNO
MLEMEEGQPDLFFQKNVLLEEEGFTFVAEEEQICLPSYRGKLIRWIFGDLSSGAPKWSPRGLLPLGVWGMMLALLQPGDGGPARLLLLLMVLNGGVHGV